MSYGRKPFELEMRKNQYKLHLKKLQDISKSNSDLHRNLLKERQEMDAMIKQSHQLHSQSMRFQLKKREKTEIETQRNNYESVRSTLKHELNRKVLPVPTRHKPDHFLLDIANLKMVDKILNAKSQFNFRDFTSDKIARLSLRKKERVHTNEDYSQLYKNSMIKEQKTSKIFLRLDKAKGNTTVKIRFLDQSPMLHFKEDCKYFIVVENESKRKKSKMHRLEDIFSSQLVLNVPQKDISISFVEKIGDKDILRFKLAIKEAELNHQETTWITTPIEDAKNRAIGVAEIELRKKYYQAPLQLQLQNQIVQDKESELTAFQTLNHNQ